VNSHLPEDSLARLEALAKLMDGALIIPGTNTRVGLDAIIGLIPGIGDAITGLISSYLIWEARKLGVSRWTLARMAGNTLIDTAVGAIPLAGDVFDVMFRANMKNGLPHEAAPCSKLESGRRWPASDLAEAERRAEQMLAARSFRAPAVDSRAMSAV